MSVTCNFKNCEKRATYAFTYGKPDRCIDHKENRKPQYSVCPCGKGTQTYNVPGETKRIYCGKCKTGEMVNVKNKRCQCGSGKRPRYNLPGETKPIYCIVCMTGEMVNVKNKKCRCGKHIPSFNLPGETTPVCCENCKNGEMINVKHKMCHCGKHRPIFNLPGETTPVCCDECKTGEMVDVVHKMCISGLCGGTQVSDDKYSGYCTHCFSNLYPTHPLTAQIMKKSKEIAVKAFINEEFKGFCHDKPIEFGCDCVHRRKVDHRKLIDGTMLCIETDENQHKGTSYKTEKEKVRYDDLVSVFTCKWIFIRYNPDKYKRKDGTKAEPPNFRRLKRLKREIDKQIKRIEKGENEELLEVIYLYYDGFT